MLNYDLSNRVALVTGASRKIGIGAEIVRQLAQAGADIFFTTYRPYDAEMPWGSQIDDVADLIDDVKGSGRQVAHLELDLSESNAPKALFDSVLQHFAQVDVLVNNATYSVNGSLGEVTAESLDKHYAVNVRAVILLCQAFVQRWNQSSGGRIINITSGQGVGAMPNEIAYVATKGAIESLTQTLSAEVVSRGITVNAVDPGITDTGWISDELKAHWKANSPMGRIGLPSDVARLICFLASDASEWITGQVLRSRGGM